MIIDHGFISTSTSSNAHEGSPVRRLAATATQAAICVTPGACSLPSAFFTWSHPEGKLRQARGGRVGREENAPREKLEIPVGHTWLLKSLRASTQRHARGCLQLASTRSRVKRSPERAAVGGLKPFRTHNAALPKKKSLSNCSMLLWRACILAILRISSRSTMTSNRGRSLASGSGSLLLIRLFFSKHSEGSETESDVLLSCTACENRAIERGAERPSPLARRCGWGRAVREATVEGRWARPEQRVTWQFPAYHSL
jgi:hypothetical protein